MIVQMIVSRFYRCIEYSRSIAYRAGKTLIKKESCPKTLIKSCSFGVFVAFSPFVCLHTVMILIGGWLYSLNIPVMFAVSWFINNPYTMVPVYALDCMFGDLFFNSLGINPVLLNPSWMAPINQFLATYIGLNNISFWSFIIGGNLLGLIMSGILYPIFSYFFMKIRN